MIIANGETDEGKTFLLLGVSRLNIEKLITGRPIKVTRESHGNGIPTDLEIAIIFGETEEEIAAQLRNIGAIKANTPVMAQPRNAE